MISADLKLNISGRVTSSLFLRCHVLTTVVVARRYRPHLYVCQNRFTGILGVLRHLLLGNEELILPLRHSWHAGTPPPSPQRADYRSVTLQQEVMQPNKVWTNEEDGTDTCCHGNAELCTLNVLHDDSNKGKPETDQYDTRVPIGRHQLNSELTC